MGWISPPEQVLMCQCERTDRLRRARASLWGRMDLIYHFVAIADQTYLIARKEPKEGSL